MIISDFCACLRIRIFVAISCFLDFKMLKHFFATYLKFLCVDLIVTVQFLRKLILSERKTVFIAGRFYYKTNGAQNGRF